MSNYFRLQKTHFWSDYYNGQLSSYGLHTLNSLCDRAIDTPKKFLDLKSIKSHIVDKSRLRSLLNTIRNYTHKCQKSLPWNYSNDNQKQSSILLRKLFYYIPLSFLIILIECIIIIYQLYTNLCNNLLNKYLINLNLILEIISSLLLFFDYTQLYYWLNQRKNLIWIILYTFAITCRLVSCIIYLIILIIKPSTGLCLIFYILKSLSLIECIILCLFFVEPLRLFLDYMLNRYISVSYDIGLAYISSEEQIIRIIHRLTDNGKIRIYNY
jgi:hypothetical protein